MGTYFVSILSIMTILSFVQFQMASPSPYSVSRCDSVIRSTLSAVSCVGVGQVNGGEAFTCG